MNQATLDYIRLHADEDVRQLALRGCKAPEVHLSFALEQIAGRQKARIKLPLWAEIDGIVYPPHLAMEQCSSEQTARYKANIAGEGHLFVDLTAGFGVDMAFISQGFLRAVHVERQAQLCAISSENYKLLGLDHIQVINGDGVDYLHTMPHADLLFIDPARRDEHGDRTYGLADCTPNVLEILDEMLEKADCVMLKLSPMLDWRKVVTDLRMVSEVHIISVDNECKELLIKVRKCDSEKMGSYRVVCVNLLKDYNREVFEFKVPSYPLAFSPSLPPTILPFHPFTFLFEPNASVMKAGCFEQLEQCFGVVQLEKNSHLFVSDTDKTSFPGRQFVIEKMTSMNKRELKETLSGVNRANITVRNFPLSVADLRKRLKLKEGGDVYIFATTIANKGHQLIVCRKKS